MDLSSLDLFDPRRLQLGEQDGVSFLAPSEKTVSVRLKAPFLRGPIPWPWIQAALRMSGRALLVGLLLWRCSGCRKQRRFRFRLARGQELFLSRSTTQRGLSELAEARLITVRHLPGQCSEVTIEEVQGKD